MQRQPNPIGVVAIASVDGEQIMPACATQMGRRRYAELISGDIAGRLLRLRMPATLRQMSYQDDADIYCDYEVIDYYAVIKLPVLLWCARRMRSARRPTSRMRERTNGVAERWRGGGEVVVGGGGSRLV